MKRINPKAGGQKRSAFLIGLFALTLLTLLSSPKISAAQSSDADGQLKHIDIIPPSSSVPEIGGYSNEINKYYQSCS